MPTVKDLLDRKHHSLCRPVCTIAPGATVLDAVQAMNRERIGALVVLDPSGSGNAALTGIFTERDVLTRVVGEKRDPATTRVADVMTARPITCTPETPIDQIRSIVTQHRVRHLPVLEQERLVGLVTTGDILAYDVAEQERTIRHLHEYITG